MKTINQKIKLIDSVSIITQLGKREIVFDENQVHKMVIDFSKFNEESVDAFDIQIVFTTPISAFRNHDYSWVKCNADRIANEYSPKIIQLSNGVIIQANITTGIWEINEKNRKVLLWRFNPEMASTIAHYSGSNNEKVFVRANQKIDFKRN